MESKRKRLQIMSKHLFDLAKKQKKRQLDETLFLVLDDLKCSLEINILYTKLDCLVHCCIINMKDIIKYPETAVHHKKSYLLAIELKIHKG